MIERIKIVLLTIITIFLYTENIYSQIVLSVKEAVLLEKDKTLIDKQIRDYAAITLDTDELLDSLRTHKYCNVRLYISEQWNWELYLVPDGPEKFKGETADNEIVLISIGENYFHGTIFSNKGDYLIRSSWFFTQNFTDKSLIAYKASDINSDNSGFDATYNATAISQEDEPQSIMTVEEGPAIRSGGVAPLFPCPVTLELAIDVDYDFYLKFGSDMVRVRKFVEDELEAIKNVYKQTFNLILDTTYVHVWTSNTDPDYPYPPLSEGYVDASNLLQQFGNYWNNHMTHIPRNIAHLFTGKDSLYSSASPKTGGMAMRRQISSPSAYSLSVYGNVMYQTIAHEIGHNLGATDNPSASDCKCGAIVKERSLMCQSDGTKKDSLWFCSQSISQISSFLTEKMSALAANVPNTQFLSGTLTGTNEYQRTLTISSTQVINSGYTSYKSATRIVLTPGFKVLGDTRFTGAIDEDIVNCDDTLSVLSRSVFADYQAPGATAVEVEESPPQLYQNHPNPFTGQTVIGYYLPETSGSAWIRVINTGGVTVKTVDIVGSGYGNVSLEANSLPPGVYFYSLLIDGRIIDSKRMMVK